MILSQSLYSKGFQVLSLKLLPVLHSSNDDKSLAAFLELVNRYQTFANCGV
jgi:hypothetical protein